MPEVATETATTSMTLRLPWRDAAQQIHAHLKIGRAIKNQRIRDQWELDHAHAEKAEWIRRTTELLKLVFIDDDIAEQATQYAPPVLPEYAEFDLFVDQFEDEMRHRLERLAAGASTTGHAAGGVALRLRFSPGPRAVRAERCGG